MKRFEATSEMIGKYVNEHLYSDIYPVGKIVGIKSKTVLLVQPIEYEKLNENVFEVGGFAGHCVNNDEQEYRFWEEGEVCELKMKSSNSRLRIASTPKAFYDYNF